MMARLVVCGVVFVLLVAAKLLFPEAVAGFARSAGRLIGRDADFREAFAAVGRAISGEEAVGQSLQEAYTAVFNPAEPSGEDAAEGQSGEPEPAAQAAPPDDPAPQNRLVGYLTPALPETPAKIGRASCRERVSWYV